MSPNDCNTQDKAMQQEIIAAIKTKMVNQSGIPDIISLYPIGITDLVQEELKCILQNGANFQKALCGTK
jgi:hypothetical protein